MAIKIQVIIFWVAASIFTLKLEVPCHITTHHHNPEDHNLNLEDYSSNRLSEIEDINLVWLFKLCTDGGDIYECSSCCGKGCDYNRCVCLQRLFCH
jgi:hypothetical protein